MNNKHIKNLLIILVISIIITIIISNIFGDDSWRINNIAMNVLYGVIIGVSLSFSGLVTRFIIGISDIEKHPSRTYVLLLIAIFLFITIDVIVLNLLWYHFVHGYEYVDIIRSVGIILITVITIFIGLTIFFIILSNNYMKRLVSAEKEIQVSKEEISQAKYETLKSQINPHFLFNSLNTLSSLIHLDTKKADEFTNKLSKIYRYILDHQDDELVTIEDEIEFVKKFAYLQSIRFDDNFSLELKNINDSGKSLIIPFSLQLLLENVFKHNIISEHQKVRVSITVIDDYIVVANSKTENKKSEISHNVGLKNIISRYEYLCDKHCIIEDTSDAFTVKLPLISEN